MTWFAELTSPRARRLQARLSEDVLPDIDSFLKDIAAGNRWDDSATQRLRAAGEETLWSLMQTGDDGEPDAPRQLTVIARPGSGMVELEFFSSLEGQNLQDRLAYLSNEACPRGRGVLPVAASLRPVRPATRNITALTS